jgi:TolA-binding protein
MIYYIVPPIIIIVVLGVLIFFISRKSDEIKKEIKKEEELELEGKGKVIISKLHVFSLAFLEKTMQRLKLVFLKSYNQFDAWMRSVRSRKEERQERIETIEEAREEADAKEELEMEHRKIQAEVLAAKKAQAEAAAEELSARGGSAFGGREKAPKTEEIKVVPMVSKKVVQPEIRRKKKSHLEEALIERIALSPRDIEAYERLGDYYVEQKNNEDALECFRQVLKLSPGNHKAKLMVKKMEKNVLGW